MFTGAKEPKLKEPCHTTSVTRTASNRTPEPNRRRLRIALFRIIGGTGSDLGDGYRILTRRRLRNVSSLTYFRRWSPVQPSNRTVQPHRWLVLYSDSGSFLSLLSLENRMQSTLSGLKTITNALN